MSRKRSVWAMTKVFLLVLAVVFAVLIGLQTAAVVLWSHAHGILALADKDSPLVTLGSTTVALLAIAVAALSYIVPNRTDRRSQNHRVLDLFLRFDDDHFRKVRDQAWDSRSRWYLLQEPERSQWRKDLIGGTVPTTAAYGVPPYKEGKADGSKYQAGGEAGWIKEGVGRDARWAVFQMLNLYEALAFFECDNHQLSRISLYYPYWRGFLYEVIDEYEHTYDSCLSSAEKAMLPREEWRKAFAILDDKLGLPPYNRRDDPQLRALNNVDESPTRQN